MLYLLLTLNTHLRKKYYTSAIIETISIVIFLRVIGFGNGERSVQSLMKIFCPDNLVKKATEVRYLV